MGVGENWYAYCGNNPMNGVDPSGLSPNPNPSGAWSVNGGTQSDAAWAMGESGMMEAQADQFMGAVRLQMAVQQAVAAATICYEQAVAAKHSAWGHYLGKTGTPISVNVKNLPDPLYEVSTDPIVQSKVKSASPGDTVNINIPWVNLDFGDLVVGRAVGHFEGTLTMGIAGQYHLDGKILVYPDTYKFNNDPNRGFGGNAVTNATRTFGNLRGGGKDFIITVQGYIPVHLRNGDW